MKSTTGERSGLNAVDAPSPLRRRKRFFMIATVIVLAAAAGVLAAKPAIGQKYFGPQVPVEALLNDVVAGNGADIVERLDVPKSADTALLTNGAYRKAKNKITGYRYVVVKRDGDTAAVSVMVEQGDTQEKQQYTLERKGARYGVFDEWVIVEAPFATVEIDSEWSAKINGVSTSLDDRTNFVMLPGDYEISDGGSSKYLKIRPVNVTIDAAGNETTGVTNTSGAIVLTAAPTEALTTEAIKQAESLIDDCVKSLGQRKICPTAASRDADRVEIEQRPTFQVITNAKGSIELVTAVKGQYKFRHPHPEMDMMIWNTFAIDFSGAITVDSEKVKIKWTIAPWPDVGDI